MKSLLVVVVVVVVGAALVGTIQYFLGIKITSDVIPPAAASIVNYFICGLAGAAIAGVSK